MKKILLVDDDPDFVQMNKAVLESNGYQVSTAQNSKKGIEELNKDMPDLLVLDVMMDTDWEGLDALPEIRKIEGGKELPIIMLTSFTDHYETGWKDKPNSEFVDVNSFLKKPVSPEKLLEEVKKYIS